MGEGEFFKEIKVRFEKQVFETRREWKKTNVWNVDLGQKIEVFSQKMCARARGGRLFSMYNQKIFKKGYSNISKSDFENNS